MPFCCHLTNATTAARRVLVTLSIQAGDKAGANAAIKQLASETKLTKYIPSGVVSGAKFVDAVGLPSGDTSPVN